MKILYPKDAQLDLMVNEILKTWNSTFHTYYNMEALPEDELLDAWSGRECIEMMEGLFETAIRLDSAAERTALYNTAMESAEIQNLDDCIIRTKKEQEAEETIRAGMIN